MYTRPGELQQLVSLVRQRRSVSVVGPMWSGRSDLLHRATAVLTESGTAVLTVRGSAGSPELEPIRVALRRTVPRRGQGPARDFAALADQLRDLLSEEGEHVLAVDDVDVLDDASRALLGAVHGQVGVPIMATGRHVGGTTASAAVTDLARPLMQITLSGLGIEATHQLLEEHLGAAISAQTTARVYRDSAGLPGLALALVDGALVSGVLRRADGQWSADRGIWADATGGVYESFLNGQPGAVREALELLALSGAVDVPVAAWLVGARRLEELEAADLVRVVSLDDSAVVAPHPPGLGDHLARHETGVRSHRLIGETLERLEHDGSGLSPVAARRLLQRMERRATRSQRPTGSGAPAAELSSPLVARMFADTHRLAASAALHAWQSTHEVADAVGVLTTQLTGRPDREAVERVLRETPEDAGGSTYAHVELRYLRARWVLAQGAGLEDALADMLRGTEHLHHRRSLTALAIALRAELDRVPPDYEQVLEPLAAGRGPDAVTARLVLAGCHVLSGRPGDGLALLPEDRDGWPPLLARSADLVTGLAHFGQGDFAWLVDRGPARIRRAAAEADQPTFVIACYLTALGLASYARVEQAREVLLGVLSSGVSAGPVPFGPDTAASTFLACMAIYTNRGGGVPGLVSPGQQRGGRSGEGLPYGGPAWYDAFDLAVGGAEREAASVLRRTAADLRERGYRLAADHAEITELALAYDPERAAELRPTVGRVGGDLYLTYLGSRQAIEDRDPDRLMVLARDFERIGAPERAGRCYSVAAALFRADGRTDAAAGARDAVRAFATEGIELPRDDFALTAGTSSVTPREREVVRLAASGLSRHRIAERLFLSARTVDTHLRNVRRKAGTSDLQQIVELLHDDAVV